MHFDRWGLSRETIGLLDLRQNIFSCGIFFCLIISSKYHNALQKAQMRYLVYYNLIRNTNTRPFEKIHPWLQDIAFGNMMIATIERSSPQYCEIDDWEENRYISRVL